MILNKMKFDLHFIIIAGILLVIINSIFIQLVNASQLLVADREIADERRNGPSLSQGDLSPIPDHRQKGRLLNRILRRVDTNIHGSIFHQTSTRRIRLRSNEPATRTIHRQHDGYDNEGSKQDTEVVSLSEHTASEDQYQRTPNSNVNDPNAESSILEQKRRYHHVHGYDIDLSSSGITSIADALTRIQYPLNDIRSLNLANNSIKDIPTGAFNKLSYLQCIDLSNNLIKSWDRRVAGDITQDLPYLGKISVANNRLADLPFFGFSNKSIDRKPVIIVADNPLLCDKEMYTRMFRKDIKNEAVRFVDASCFSPFLNTDTPLFNANNSINIEEKFFAEHDTRHPCPKGCQCYTRSVDVQHYTKCNGDETGDSIPQDIWNGTNVLELEDFAIVRIQTNSPISRLVLLEELHAKDINLKYIANGVFTDLVHLRLLDLSKNEISTITPANFSDVPSLEVLLLANNSIRSIAHDSFDELKHLRNLTLNNNFFNGLPVNVFDYNKKLTYLTLHGNEIDFLPRNVFENNTALEYLSLPDKWYCNCSNMWLKDWLKQDDSPVKDVNDIICEGNGVSLVDTPDYYFKEKCDHHTQLTLPTAAAAIVFVLVCVLLLRNRELVLVTIYANTGYRFCNRRIRQQDSEQRPFDALIVYGQSDFDFAYETLYQTLHTSYRICFDHINFIPNTTDHENILTAVNCSKRVILVLSQHFISDEYCQLAFTTAHQENMRDHVNRIIVIQTERIDNSNLPSDLKVYLSRTTKSKIWKDSRLFWQRLHYRMPDKPSMQSDIPTANRPTLIHRHRSGNSLILDISPDEQLQPLLSLQHQDSSDVSPDEQHQPLQSRHLQESGDDLCIRDPQYIGNSLILDISPDEQLQPLLSLQHQDSSHISPDEQHQLLQSRQLQDSGDDDDDLCILNPRYSERTRSVDNILEIANSSHTNCEFECEIESASRRKLCVQAKQSPKHAKEETSNRSTLRLDTSGRRHADLLHSEQGSCTPMSRILLEWPQSQDSDGCVEEQVVSSLVTTDEESLDDYCDEQPTFKGGQLTLL
ncbi:uncharacterized protein [Amphiura filiformis]|uniref:uncharacterized protein n=1 Tax=Amphiura filiformis TaxID=82378 RepID=UPI003B21A162